MNDQLIPLDAATVIERVVIGGDLAQLTAEQRVTYYRRVCESLELNPLTKPFSYLTLSGRLVLYANKDATEQLRSKRRISIIKLEREKLDDVYCVTAYAQSADGRTDSSIGAVSVAGLRGDALANAMMKAETKAKRRVTLSISGLGMLDETEVESIKDAAPVVVTDAGVITQAPTRAPTITEVMHATAPANGDEAKPTPEEMSQAMPSAVEQAPHWSDDAEVKRVFITWVIGAMSMDIADMHLTLGVEHLREFKGSRKDAEKLIKDERARRYRQQLEMAKAQGKKLVEA